MAIKTATPANFAAQLAQLHNGDTLLLAPGEYGKLDMMQRHMSGVTIKGGTFSHVQLYDVTGVRLEQITVKFVPSATSTYQDEAVRIFGSSNVSLTNSKISGGLALNGVAPEAVVPDATRNVVGLPVGRGIEVDFSTGVTLLHNDIATFAKGIVFNVAKRLSIVNNDIHDLRTTPISGSVLSGLKIAGNHSWDSNPWHFGDGGAGDHGDRIHIWTTTQKATGVVISNNRLEQGAGAPMLGIYLDDNDAGLGFEKVIIAHNTIVDGTGQGIRLENTSGILVDNRLIWSGTGREYNDTPRIQLADNSHDLQLVGNSARVSINAGVHDIDIFNETGAIDKAAALTAADQKTITVATGSLATALQAIGMDVFGNASSVAGHLASFGGLDLAGHAASVQLHPLNYIA